MIETITEDCEVTGIQPAAASNCNDDVQFPINILLAQYQSGWSTCQGDIEGKKLFEIKCLTREWAEGTHEVSISGCIPQEGRIC